MAFSLTIDRCGMTNDMPGAQAWTKATTPFERVRSVAKTVSHPRTAAWIADVACVSEDTARHYLDQLVTRNVLLKHDDEETPKYAPDPSYTRNQAVEALRSEHDHSGLVRLKEELQEQIKHAEDERELLEYRLTLVTDALRTG